MENRPKNILIVLLGAIGDVVRGIPLAVRVKRSWPDSKITWAVEPKSAGLVQGHPSIDEVIVFQRSGGFSEFRRFRREIAAGKFDLVLDLQRHLKSGLTSRASRARRRIGFHRRNAKEFNWLFNTETIEYAPDTVPKIQHYQLFGDHLGLEKSDALAFDLPSAGRERAEELILRVSADRGFTPPSPDKRVALLIGGSWRSKRWPAERFRSLAETLTRKMGFTVYLFGSADEAAMAHTIGTGIHQVGSLVGHTSLPELVACLATMNLAVGSDSGPMHIAAAVGTPVISLWGPTDPVRTGPYQSEGLVLTSPIGCAPCYRRCCPGLDNLCMSDIPSEAVIARIRQLLAVESAV